MLHFSQVAPYATGGSTDKLHLFHVVVSDEYKPNSGGGGEAELVTCIFKADDFKMCGFLGIKCK